MHSKDDYAAARHFLPNGTDAERIALAMAFHRAFWNGYASASNSFASELDLMRQRHAQAGRLHQAPVVPLVAA